MKKVKKISLIVLGLLIIGLLLMFLFSKYTYNRNNSYKSVDYSIEINVPVDTVYKYLGDSDNAREWSSFVDHITPLNSEKFEDGTVGAKRRCFKNADEKGIVWDEEIVEVIPNKKRRLTIYDMKGFSVQADGLQTEQLYESISKERMRLTFSVFFRDYDPSFIDILKMNYASYKMYSIFEANLKNVKRILEGRN